MTHPELVDVARRWLLSHGCPVVLTEVTTANRETPDAIGFFGGGSILVECKASRADFRADAHKAFRRMPELGLCGQRYYLCEPGVISESDLPSRWGLLEATGQRVRRRVLAEAQAHDQRSELRLLLSVVRRLGVAHCRGVSIRKYLYETQNTASLSLVSEDDFVPEAQMVERVAPDHEAAGSTPVRDTTLPA